MNSNELKELRRLIKNFNQKIRYYKRKAPSMTLPKPLKISEVTKNILTNEDYNNWINLLNSAKSKNAFEEVVVDEIKTTKWEAEKYYLIFKTTQLAKQEKREKYGYFSEDELIKRGLGNVYESENLIDGVFPLEGGKKVTWDKFTRNAEDRLYKLRTDEYLKQYRENYYKSLRYLGSGENIIKRYLDTKSDEFIMKGFYSDPFLHIEFNYPTDYEAPDEYLWIVSRVLNSWKQFEKNYSE